MDVCKSNHGLECIKCTPGPCNSRRVIDIPMPPVKEPISSKDKIFKYVMKTSQELDYKSIKREITEEDYMFAKGVLIGLMKAYVWTYGEDENYKTMIDEVE